MNNWHSLDINEVYNATGSSENGLSSNQVKERLEKILNKLYLINRYNYLSF